MSAPVLIDCQGAEQYNNSPGPFAAPAMNTGTGNKLVVWVGTGAYDATVTVQDTAGNVFNLVAAANYAAFGRTVYPFVCDSSIAQVGNVISATSATTGYCEIVVMEWSGLGVIDAATGAGGFLGDDPVTGTFSTVDSDELSICGIRTLDVNGTFSPGAQDGGYTIPTNGAPNVGGGCFAVEYNLFSYTKTNTVAGFVTGGDYVFIAMGVITFKLTGGGFTGNPWINYRQMQ